MFTTIPNSFSYRHEEISAIVSNTFSICDSSFRLQNVSYFCVFKYTRAVKQTVWKEANNRERDWGETPHTPRATKTLTPRFTDFFTDFEKKKKTFFRSVLSI